jgi:hypothetical protein
LNQIRRSREIERRAGRAFAGIGMSEIAADEPPSVAELESFVAAGRALVATGAPRVAMRRPVSSTAER